MAKINFNINKKNSGNLEEEFIKKLKKVEEEVTGHDTLGDSVEFFDEDGVVLVTVSPDINLENSITFKFGIDDTAYSVSGDEIKIDI